MINTHDVALLICDYYNADKNNVFVKKYEISVKCQLDNVRAVGAILAPSAPMQVTR